MSDTIREKIIQQFVTRLATIRTANGYNTEIGSTVERARKSLDPDDLPACVVYPQPETAEPLAGMTQLTMPIRIEGLAKYGSANPSVVAEMILGDLIKCILSSSWDRRTLIPSPVSPATYIDQYDSGVEYKGGGTDDYPNAEDQTVGVSALFEVSYLTKRGNPYEQ